jgi:hypothetical protein
VDECQATVTTYTGTPEEFLERARTHVRELPEDQLARMTLAVQLYLTGHEAEAAEHAQQVLPAEAGTSEDPREIVRSALIRSAPLFVSEYPEEMRAAAQEQYDLLFAIFEQHEG